MSVALGDVGPLIVATDIDRAVIGLLQDWVPTYLRVISDERALPTVLPSPRLSSYANSLDTSEWLDHAVPAILVTTAETSAVPSRNADGSYSAGWVCAISAVVRGRSGSETRDTASFYEGAIRRLMAQQSHGHDIIHSALWQGTRIAPLPDQSRAGRYLAAGMSTFAVSTDRALKGTAGPTVPMVDYVATVPVTEVDLTVAGANERIGG